MSEVAFSHSPCLSFIPFVWVCQDASLHQLLRGFTVITQSTDLSVLASFSQSKVWSASMGLVLIFPALVHPALHFVFLSIILSLVGSILVCISFVVVCVLVAGSCCSCVLVICLHLICVCLFCFVQVLSPLSSSESLSWISSSQRPFGFPKADTASPGTFGHLPKSHNPKFFRKDQRLLARRPFRQI